MPLGKSESPTISSSVTGNASLAGSPSQPQTRVYGLTIDLRQPSEHSSSGTSTTANNDGSTPNFSVELFAPAFDSRDYPVYSGRAAALRGVVRMPAEIGCDVVMKISAHTTAGAPAAVWQGLALAPQDLGEERKVFEVRDLLTADFEKVCARDSFAPRNEAQLQPALEKEDYLLPIPFDVNLPLGKATRIVDGQVQAVAVSLPPSFEISSKAVAAEKAAIRNATKGKGKGPSARELMERGLEKVYRIGCYYRVSWTLQRSSSTGKAVKGGLPGDTITVPFVFLGETTTLPPHPSTIPSVLSTRVITQPGTSLGPDWEVHRTSAKWSGSLFKTLRRSVDLELHLPTPATLHSPSHVPLLMIIRPSDPNLLRASTRQRTESGGSIEVSSPTDGVRNGIDPGFDAPGHSANASVGNDSESIRTTRSIVRRWIRPSISLARIPSQSTASDALESRRPVSRSQAAASLLFGRRPSTAPSTGSSETAVTISATARSSGHGEIPDLSSLVCVSLVQTTYCSTDSINDAPESRRKLLSVADLEEVDIHALLLNSDSPDGGNGSGRPASEFAEIHEAASLAKAAGVRALVGSLRVAPDTTPSFRSQGLEVKYALKVDLLPFNRNSPDSLDKALQNLGIRNGRSRGFSEGQSTTASIHTQTQFTIDGSTPPTTPPSNFVPNAFGSGTSTRSPESDSASSLPAWPNPQLPRGWRGPDAGAGSPVESQGNGPLHLNQSPTHTNRIAADADLAFSPASSSVNRFPGLNSRSSSSFYGMINGTPTFSNAGSGWGSNRSISEVSMAQSSTIFSEWGKDRKTVSKLHKTIGALWIDVRMVRGQAHD
ncbi:hypothetical protein IE53DRAFT_315772 [Violaceomyces palustris]|uniref:Uncharacterized protein n=1 Tax=Violaceomyces palustris TaxID=1673888 RepID=A0ACD0NX95_9BASI|nr:hypothetical protein IE53DRAFT_315772 [Violaceomyces palustris]